MLERISSRTAGLCGILGPIVSIIFIGAAISIHPWFSFADNALSDLGAIGTSNNYVFNIGLILTGIFALIFTLGLIQFLDRKLGRIGAVIFGAGNVSLILIGIFPEGMPLHYPVSIGFFALAALGIFIEGIDQLRKDSTRPWGILIICILFLAGASIVLTSTIPYDFTQGLVHEPSASISFPIAISETIGSIVYGEFTIVFGARMLDVL